MPLYRDSISSYLLCFKIVIVCDVALIQQRKQV